MANKYYTHYSIKDPQEASIFSNSYAWAIFDILRIAGVKGLTASKIHKQLERKMRTDISQSKTYGLLKRLYEEKWIHRFYDRKAEKQRNVLALESGEVYIDPTFDDLVANKEKKYISHHFFPVFSDFLRHIIEDFNSDSNARKWLPEKKEFCKGCGKNHEAQEFFNCILDIATAEFQESEEYTEFLKSNYYMENEDEIEN
jgi:hypothetical protein